ncbi:MAG TPA: LssY C-terminal domain-containing protein [Bryobacteraceae bacterium]|nr:LssY C-terminal domain-containing protein [Bryobacteraceae bacterium]
MPGKTRWSAWVAVLIICSGAPELPAATRIKARLLNPVSSYRSKVGDPVEALVVPPACPEPSHAFPPATVVAGRVQSLHRVGLGIEHETARLRLDFSSLRFSDGQSFPIASRLAEIDNARERVDRHGAVHGIRATASLSSRLGSRIALEAFEHPFLLGPALVLESELFRFPDPEIEYDRGTEISLDVTLPPALAAPTCPTQAPDAAAGTPNELGRIVASLPAWSYSKRQPQPMDLINLVFVGTRRSLEAAFTAAGWTGARPNSMAAGLHAVRAIAEEREYNLAPMRTLLLNGDEPDLRLQTTLNTFEKRDHLRIWEQRDEFDGRPVWASAATRDLATTFSMGHPFGFTHEIQSNLDLERDKVVSDLQLTGCVDSVEFVRRGPAAGVDARKGVYTDSRLAVIILNSCETPTADFSESVPEPPPAFAVRFVRRLTLTTRNHFLRDNIVWRSADAARLGVDAVRHWYSRRNEQRLAAASLRASLQ